MNKTFRIRTLLAASIAVLLLTPVSSFAVEVEVAFEWRQNSNDKNLGSGELTAFLQIGADPNGDPIGIDFSAPMPVPDFYFQKDQFSDFPLNNESFDTNGVTHPNDPNRHVNAVGFSNQVVDLSPVGGNDNGFYIGWGLGGPNGGNSRTVNLTGSFGGDDFTLPIEMAFRFGDFNYWEAVQFDNIDVFGGGFDVVTTGGRARFSGYIGNSLDGHRHTGDSRTHVVGQDIFVTNDGISGELSDGGNPQNGGKGQVLDGSGYLDNIGITYGLRNYDDSTGSSGAVYIGDIVFGGTLVRNALLIEPQIIFSGDVNFDSVVDIDDLNIILENFNQVVTTRSEGDLTGDNFVSFEDFSLFKQGFLAAGGIMADLYGVPEPSTAVLVIMCTAVCTLRRPRAHLSPV